MEVTVKRRMSKRLSQESNYESAGPSKKSRKVKEIGLANLHDDILVHILSFLQDPYLKGNLARVNRRWSRLIGDKRLWKFVDLSMNATRICNVKTALAFIRSQYSQHIIELKFEGVIGKNIPKVIASKPTVTKKLLNELQVKCVSLKKLSIVKADLSSNNACAAFSLTFVPPSIKSLNLHGSSLKFGTLADLPSLRHLTTLNLSGSTLSGKDSKSFNALINVCPKLEQLFLRNCDRFAECDVNKLSNTLKRVKILDISGIPTVTDEFVLNLTQNSKKLINLDISNCKKITEDGLLMIVSCVRLTEWNIAGLKFGKRLVNSMGKMPSLRKFTVAKDANFGNMKAALPLCNIVIL